MKLKIISDGTKVGTRLVNAETGEAIGLIQNLKWEVDVKEPFTKVTVTLLNVGFEMESSEVTE